MLLRRLFREEPVLKSNDFVLKVRLGVFSVAWVHLCIAAVLILPLDMSADEDPRIRAYSRLRWRFITAWFNLIDLVYFPLCLYCDWKEKRGEDAEPLVVSLRRVRDVIFTSVLFPTILWADLMFWRIYYKDMALIAPPRLFNYMPPWGQHSLHTVSLAMAIFDLLLVPRKRPEKLKSRFKLMIAFFSFYYIVILERYLKGEMVYQMLGTFSKTEIVLFTVLCYVEYSVYFSLQWLVIEYIWGKEHREIKKAKLK